MDVETQSGYLALFDGPFPWHDEICQQIERRRGMLNDQLLFDTLLLLGGIREPDTLYPPRDAESLQLLLDAIINSQYDQLKRDCLVYFLLKWYGDRREVKFQTVQSIPPQFCALSDAYWYLDAGIEVSKAVSILADHRLNRDYASKILQAISYSDDPSTLIIKYVRTAKPPLVEQEDIKLYTIALADKSFFEAWQFQRTFNELDETRPRLIKRLFEWCVTPAPRETPLRQLVGLPLSPFEQSIFHAYALHPPTTLPSKSIAVLQELVCVRLIENGQYSDAVKLDRQFSSISPLKGQNHLTQSRSETVRDVYLALPHVERTVLDLEVEAQDKATSSNGGDVRMTNGSSGNAASAIVTPPAAQGFRKPQNAARKSLGASLTASMNSFKPRTSIGISSQIPAQPLASSSSLNNQPPPSKPPTALFESASRRQNAFFQPPKESSRRQSANSPFTFANLNGSLSRREDIEMDMDGDQDMNVSGSHPHDEDDTHALPPPAEMSFSKSVFDNLPTEPATNGRPTKPSRPSTQVSYVNGTNGTKRKASTKMPPGAFIDESHHDEEQEEDLPMPATKQARRGGQRVPGALMDDEDDEENEDVAPLRSPEPVRRTKKGRVSETTVEVRRRSSRLSAAPAEPAVKKKSASTTKGKKKR